MVAGRGSQTVPATAGVVAAVSAAAAAGGRFLRGRHQQRARAGAVRARGLVRPSGGDRARRAGQLHRSYRVVRGRRKRTRGNGERQGPRDRRRGGGAVESHRGFRGSDQTARPDVCRAAHLRVPVARRLLLSVLVDGKRARLRPRFQFRGDQQTVFEN